MTDHPITDCLAFFSILTPSPLTACSQLQRTSLNRDTCSVLSPYRVETFAAAVNAEYLKADTDADLDPVLERAREASRSGRPVMLEVAIDYSQKTFFTRGILATNFWRLPLGDRVRMLGRAAARHVSGALAGPSRPG